MKQGDPLSPLIFCLAEDVLSRSISKLVLENKMELIKGTRNIKVHPHTFYVDDLMIFCKGEVSGLNALKDLFIRYALESGQIVNKAKSTIFSGSITPRRLDLIIQLINFIIEFFFLLIIWKFQLVKTNQRLIICNLYLKRSK